MKKNKRLFKLLKTPHGLFTFIALIFGGIFLLVIPPFQTPDEAAHFLRAYQVSNGDFVPSQKDGVTGSYLPKSLQKTEWVVDGGTPLQTQPNVKYRLGNTKAALVNVPLNESDKGFVDTTVTASYSPLGYIPQVIAILFGRLFALPPIIILYLAKIAVLLAWIGFVFVAIKLFPFKKWAVVGIALLPMFVAQSVSMGVDVMAIGAGLVFTAAALNVIARRQSVTRRIFVILLVSGVVMVLSKQVMAVLLPVVFALKFNAPSRHAIKGWAMKLSIIITPIVLLFAWSALLPQVGQSVTQIQNQQDTTGQIKGVVEDPLGFVRVVFNTFFIPGAPGNGVVQSLMGNFGWLDTPLALVFVIVGYVALFGFWLVNYEKMDKVSISKRTRFLFLAITILYFFAVCGAMYVLFSPLGSSLIVGIQGRYLFPCLFLLLPVFYSGLILMKERHFVRATVIVTVFLLLVSAGTIFARYYVNA